MATSGSIDFNMTALEIVQAAVSICEERTSEIPLTNNEISDGIKVLNRMSKHWQTKFHLWKRKEGVIFLRTGVNQYNLGGTSPDKACLLSDFINTTITTAAVTGATTLVVSSTTGMVAADKIGIQLDDGTRQWTTIVSVDSATGLTITAALTDDVAVGNTVFTFTTDLERPLRVESTRRRLITNNTEVELNKIARQQYMALTNKTSQGTPTSFFYAPRLTNGEYYIWQTANSVNQVLYITFNATLEDFDTSSNNPDFPVEWCDALVWNLAERLSFEYQVDFNKLQLIQVNAAQYLDDALGWDEETTSLNLMPDFN